MNSWYHQRQRNTWYHQRQRIICLPPALLRSIYKCVLMPPSSHSCRELLCSKPKIPFTLNKLLYTTLTPFIIRICILLTNYFSFYHLALKVSPLVLCLNYCYYYLFYQFGTGRDTQKALSLLSKAIGIKCRVGSHSIHASVAHPILPICGLLLITC